MKATDLAQAQVLIDWYYIPANAADPFDTRAKVLSAIQGHVIGKAVYMGLFHRPE